MKYWVVIHSCLNDSHVVQIIETEASSSTEAEVNAEDIANKDGPYPCNMPVAVFDHEPTLINPDYE